MTRHQSGFSLTEALITLLVVSIGWLGLGQLQVRLSTATMNRSSAAYAQLLQSVYYEKMVSYELSGIPENFPDTEPVSTPSTTYKVQLSPSVIDTLSDTRIEIEWTDINNTRNEVTSLTLNTHPDPYDTRWLLAAPITSNLK